MKIDEVTGQMKPYGGDHICDQASIEAFNMRKEVRKVVDRYAQTYQIPPPKLKVNKDRTG